MTRTQTVARCRKDRLKSWQAMRRGVRLLDCVLSPSWREYVDPWTLDMGHDQRCVLAQVDYYDADAGYGDYSGGLFRVGLDNGRQHGFDIVDPLFPYRWPVSSAHGAVARVSARCHRAP